MATASQIAANQHNAQSSTGPRTPEGKAAASRNALKYGLASSFTVLQDEDQSEFDTLLEDYRVEFGPQGQHESFLVDQMAQSRWKLARIQRLETSLFERALLTERPEDWKVLSNLHRYATAAERSYYKAHHELEQTRKNAQQTRSQALDDYIEAYINAPMPGRAAQSNLMPFPEVPAPAQPAVKAEGRPVPAVNGA